MITWMQKHKKWLTVTIWISTIAFVGAGFVGWGAYKYGMGAGKVAKVGDVEISLKEFSQRYSNIYAYYNKMMKGELTEKKAKELKLQQQALTSLITEAMLLNLAKEFGLEVLDEEIGKKIASYKEFKKDGEFNKRIYLEVLKNAHIKPKDFEEGLKKEILIEKVQKIVEPVLNKAEIEAFGSAIFITDKIEYKIIDGKNIEVNLSKNEIKNFWEKNKNRYKTKEKFQLSILWEDIKENNASIKELKEFYAKNREKFLDEKGELLSFDKAQEKVKKELLSKKARKKGLRRYIDFKKGKIKTSQTVIIAEDSAFLPHILIEEIKKSKENKVLKPKLINNRYAIIKVVKKIPPRTKSLKEAMVEVKMDLKDDLIRQKLLQIGKKEYKSFYGKKSDYISRDDVDKLKPLNELEASQFLEELFESDKKKGYIFLDSQKVILYKILDQKLTNFQKLSKNKEFITDNSLKLKKTVFNNNFLKFLQKRYEVEIFYKGQ